MRNQIDNEAADLRVLRDGGDFVLHLEMKSEQVSGMNLDLKIRVPRTTMGGLLYDNRPDEVSVSGTVEAPGDESGD